MRHQNELLAGIFITMGVGLLALTILVLGNERQIFSRQHPYYTSFRDVQGLAPGAPVRLGGIPIGRVASIGFSERLVDQNIYVTLLINAEYIERMHEDSVVTIETQGLLGDRFVSISAGTEPKRLSPGSQLRSAEATEITQILGKAGNIVDQTSQIATSVHDFLQEFKSTGSNNLNRLLQNLAGITEEVTRGSGLAHRLLYSNQDGEEIARNVNRTIRDVRAITREIRSGQGLLHALIFEPQGKETVHALQSAALKVESAATHLGTLTEEIQSGKGLLHYLIYGSSPKGIDEMLANLSEAARNLKTASEALASGSGTLGALLVDSKLYDNLVEVTDDAKRSLILRHAIRSSLEKKRKAD